MSRTFVTRRIPYDMDDLYSIREKVAGGATATDAVLAVVPEAAGQPRAIQAIVTTARTHGMIRFDREAWVWLPSEPEARTVGRPKVCPDRMVSRSIYVPDAIWSAFRAKHGTRTQDAIRGLLERDLA